MTKKLTRGMIVKVPTDKFISEREWDRSRHALTKARLHRQKAIVLKATSKSVVVCSYNPGEKPSRPGGRDQPWISKFATGPCHGTWKDPSDCAQGFKVIGKVKRVPRACNRVLKERIADLKRYGGMSTHVPSGFKPGGGNLDGARRRKRKRW